MTPSLGAAVRGLALFGALVATIACGGRDGPPPRVAGEGEPCGPTAEGGVASPVACGAGLSCRPKPTPTSPTSPTSPSGLPAERLVVGLGGGCGGVAGIRCVEGLVCGGDPMGPADGMGRCVAPSVCVRGGPGPAPKAASGPGGDSGVGWKELTLESSYGPCPADGRSCFSKTHVFPDGRVVRDETLNPTQEERRAHPDAPRVASTTRTLAPANLAKLDALLRSRDFRRDVRGHFACAQAAFDANLAFSVTFDDGTAHQDVTTCIIDASKKPNLANDVVELLGVR